MPKTFPKERGTERVREREKEKIRDYEKIISRKTDEIKRHKENANLDGYSTISYILDGNGWLITIGSWKGFTRKKTERQK